MSDLAPVIELLLAEVDAERPVALCTVLRTRGSTPQGPGATMLVRVDGKTHGTLGGGCVEAEVRKRALEMLARRESGLLDFVLDHDYGWDDGLLCGGRMFVGVMPCDAKTDLSPYRAAFDEAKRRRPASFPVVVHHEGRTETYRVHLEVPPTLLIAGAGHVGQALAKLAVELDFHVVVIDDRADCASRDRFGDRVDLIVADIPMALRDYPIDPGCHVVIVTRGHQHDEQALEAVIRSPAGYIGLIGSKRKSRLILEDLKAAGVSQELLDRVHTPIGLEIGAVTVPEIAVSIAGQLIEVRRNVSPSLVDGPLES